jgi:hypothetical protein
MPGDAFELTKTYIHLGSGATATEVPDFSWSPQNVMSYLRRFASDRSEGRLVGVVPAVRSWSHWERHAEGDEVVMQLDGCSDVVQDLDGEYRTIRLRPGQAIINPRNVWHTSDVHEPGQTLFIVAGRKTDYRPRDRQQSQ